MTGRRYYITSLADWHRHAARFANSHWLALRRRYPRDSDVPQQGTASVPDPTPSATGCRRARILVLVEADEGVHLALEDDSAFEALPHPLASKPISAPPKQRSQPRRRARRHHVRRHRARLPRASTFAPSSLLTTMHIRPYNESDLAALQRMHAAQGFDYTFPDLADPIFISKLVVEDHAGRAVWRRSRDSPAKCTCLPIPTLARRAIVTTASSPCIPPARAISPPAASTTRTLGSLQKLPHASAAASRR